MQSAVDRARQLVVTAAIVTTLALGPIGALLALFSYLTLGVSFSMFMTFGGAMNEFEGLLAWWGLAFIPAFAYTAFLMPWDQKKW